MPAAALATDDGAPWHQTMLELAGSGIKEYPGGDDNPTILGWARHIGLTYPEMAGYANNYKHDSIAWCGLTGAEVLARNGVRPPYDPADDLKSFLWANSFADPAFADKLDLPRIGCFVVFKWDGGGGHVATLKAWNAARRTLEVVGGNQSNAVTTMTVAWDHQVVGFFWPRKVAAGPSTQRTPPDVRRRMGEKITLAEARLDANGHVAVYKLPANDGGGSFEVAGINERYHPVMANKLKRMIENREPDQAVRDAIGDYTASFTNAADVWFSSWGLEFYGRDSIFHRGPTGAAKIVQRALVILGENIGQTGNRGDGVDGDVGPLTSDAIRRQEGNFEAFLAAMRRAREEYEEQDIGHRANFWQGFINRWNNQMVVARRFHAEQPKDTAPMPDQPTTNVPNQPPQPTGPIAVPQVGLPFDFLNASMTPEQENRILRTVLIAMLLRQTGGVDLPTGLIPSLPAPKPATPPPPAVVEPASVPVQPTQPASDKAAVTLGGLTFLATLAQSFLGGAPVMGPDAGTVAPATAVLSLATTALGALGGVSPIFGTIGKVLSGVMNVAGFVKQQQSQPPKS